jgi:hypothetical protein
MKAFIKQIEYHIQNKEYDIASKKIHEYYDAKFKKGLYVEIVLISFIVVSVTVLLTSIII